MGPRESESLCGTVEEPGNFMEPQKCGTVRNLNFMWKEALWTLEPLNLGKPELLRLEPLCGTLINLVPGFGRLPHTTAKLYWKNSSFSSCWGKKSHLSLRGTVPLKSPQSLIFSLLGCSCKFGGTFMWNLVEPQLLRVEPLLHTGSDGLSAVTGMLRCHTGEPS